MRFQLSPAERVEFDALVRETVGNDNAPKATAELADKLYAGLLDADQAQSEWARRALQHATRLGLKSMLRTWVRSRTSVGYRTRTGRVVGLSRRAGVKRGDTFQQVMFEDMTPDEARAYLSGIEAQLSGLGALRTSVHRLVRVIEAHPAASTVGEALAAEGRSLDDVIGAAA